MPPIIILIGIIFLIWGLLCTPYMKVSENIEDYNFKDKDPYD